MVVGAAARRLRTRDRRREPTRLPPRAPRCRASRSGSFSTRAGMDDRKNFEALFRAWGRLPDAVRERLAARDGVQHGRSDAQPSRAPRARQSGIESRLLLPGFVPDAVLQLLYQSTDLFVFPSLYEGYGLPVAEAMACGARTIGSGTSSVAELLVPEAQFDPANDDAIARRSSGR